jgi:hypothetical protein
MFTLDNLKMKTIKYVINKFFKDEEMDENFEDQIDYDKVYQRRVVNDLSRLWLNI